MALKIKKHYCINNINKNKNVVKIILLMKGQFLVDVFDEFVCGERG